MAATITKIYQLRTGECGFTATDASVSDPYIVRVSEQVDKVKVAELFVAYPGAPIPKVTLKAFGDNFVVCDRIACKCVSTQRYLWEVTVYWKELEDTPPRDQSSPFPNSNSVDPADWSPTVTRRAVTVFEPAETLFYESGYTGYPHTLYDGNTTAGNRSPFTNSAMSPYEDNLPPHQRKQSLWTIRWLRATVPAGITDHELKLNDKIQTFAVPGFSEAWLTKTAKIEAISITQTKWGTQRLWEITMEILHDADGHYIKAQDEGLLECYYPGEPLPSGTSTLVRTQMRMKDGDDKPIPVPTLLNGEGKKATTGSGVVAIWRDHELTDFNAVPLLGDLIT